MELIIVITVEAKQNLIEAIKAISTKNGTCACCEWTRNNNDCKAALIKQLADKHGEIYDGSKI